jgi:hypothetical protein
MRYDPREVREQNTFRRMTEERDAQDALAEAMKKARNPADLSARLMAMGFEIRRLWP